MKTKKTLLLALATAAVVSVSGAFASCELLNPQEPPPANPVVEISVSGNYTVEYQAGEKFDPTGMVVTVTYADNTQAVVTDYTYYAEELTVVDSAVTIGYGEASTSVAVTVLDDGVNFTGLTVAREPNRTVYHEGDEFRPRGLMIVANYSDQSVAVITDYTYITGAETLASLKTTDSEIVVGYNGKTVSIPVEVKAQSPVVSLDVVTAPEKTVYTAGELFDNTGMEVTATFEDGYTLTLESDEYTVPTTPIAMSDRKVTISYGGEETEVDIFAIGKSTSKVTSGTFLMERAVEEGVFTINVKHGTLRQKDGTNANGDEYKAGDYDANMTNTTDSRYRMAAEEYIPIAWVDTISMTGKSTSNSNITFLLGWNAYDEDFNYICSDNATGEGVYSANTYTGAGIIEHVNAIYALRGVPEEERKAPVYFRIAIKPSKNKDLLLVRDVIEGGKLTITPVENCPVEFKIGVYSDLKYTYGGESLGESNVVAFETDTFITPSTKNKVRDGAVYGNYLFTALETGKCDVYDVTNDFAEVTSFDFDLSVMGAQFNTLMFGTQKYDENDEFPLLYANVWDNYSGEEDKKLGHLLAFRIVKTVGEDGTVSFTSALVQVIHIGFAGEMPLWSSNEGDSEPYGNFAVDGDKLYAFVARSVDATTRFFEFNMPAATDGETVEGYGEVKVVTLGMEDILRAFDTSFMHAQHGVTIKDGKLYSLEGTRANLTNVPTLRVIDLETATEIAIIDLVVMGMPYTPEALFFIGDTLYTYDINGRESSYSRIGHFIFY